MVAEMIGVEVSHGRVLPEWIDVNGHMNVAWYIFAFDHGVDSLWNSFGITDEHIRDMNSSTFAGECHVIYRRELQLDERFVVTSQILAVDEKRIHQFQRLYNAEQKYLAATAEWMNLHVDLTTRRVAPWPDYILEDIKKVFLAQGNWPYPDDAGRQMHVPNPVVSIAKTKVGRR
ncbi:MAG: thioesterase family protein [Gammaproteobacteria bacterium]|nr:thioesterase family protein [Gammaproteobacteria bacterium]